MTAPLDPKILDAIIALPDDWHDCGTVSDKVLKAIAKYSCQSPVKYSIETGSGRSTLLFSHLSPNHTVFALDYGGSVKKVRESSLLRKESVHFVEGVTQQTLPNHIFKGKIQLAMIDGPHGYPFPDLEYYYIYPQLAPGALLIVDDIRVPTIHNMYSFIRSDKMFSLIEVVSGNTAFFKRTDAPAFDPFGDGWWLQQYNKGTRLRFSRLLGKFRSLCNFFNA